MNNGEATFDPDFIPEPARNNIWYRRSDTGTVLVFVHGVLSDSRSCWLSTAEQTHEYWPRLIAGDERFKDVGIYLGGYYTAVDAGRYEIRNAADELRDALSRRASYEVFFRGNGPKIGFRDQLLECPKSSSHN
jgi:hypothetical protein